MSFYSDQNTQDNSKSIGKKEDIFENQIQKHQQSKTVKILNLIYSLIIGIVGSVVTKKYMKYGLTMGIIMGLISFLVGKKALKNDQ